MSPAAQLLIGLLPEGTFTTLLNNMKGVSEPNRDRLAALEEKGDWNGVAQFAQENIAIDPFNLPLTTMFGKKIKSGYESDATRLIRDLLHERPQLVDEQAKGRSLWWDRKLDLDQQQRVQASRVRQKGYVYQND